MNIEKILAKITLLESKSNLSSSEKQSLARCRYMINNQEKEKLRAENISKKALLLKETDPEKYQEIINKRGKGIKKYNEENPELLEKRIEKGSKTNKSRKHIRTEKHKVNMRKGSKNYLDNVNKEEFLKRYEILKETIANKPQEEKDKINIKRGESIKATWKEIKKDEEKMASRSEKISKAISGEKNHMKRPEQRERASKVMKEKWENNEDGIRERIQEAISEMHKTKGNPGYKSQRFEFNGYDCQGTFELFHINLVFASNAELPNKKKKYVETPYGCYHPDFEYKEYYEEIKSDWTFRIFIGQDKNIDGEFQNEQMQKIIWIGKNIKPVFVIIYDTKYKLENIICFDKDYDDSKFDYKPSKIVKIKLSKEERLKIAKEVGMKQRGKPCSPKQKESLKATVKKRKEENPEFHKDIYERAKNTKKENLAKLTEVELQQKKSEKDKSLKKMWDVLKSDPEKMAIRRKKNRDSKNLPPQEIFDKINAFTSTYISIFPKDKLSPVLQFSFSGEFIKEFVSAQTARKETSITTIMDCVKGRQDTAGGFIWR